MYFLFLLPKMSHSRQMNDAQQRKDKKRPRDDHQRETHRTQRDRESKDTRKDSDDVKHSAKNDRRHEKDRRNEKVAVVEPHIEPWSAADYMFNNPAVKKVRTGTHIVLSAGQIFKTVLLSNKFHGFIYCKCPDETLDVVHILETCVDRWSHVQFCFEEPECLKVLKDDIHCVLDEKDYKELNWNDVPTMFSSAVRDFCKKTRGLADGTKVYFKIDIKKCIDAPVSKKPTLTYAKHPGM